MQSRGPLMIEHRLIERMIARINKALEDIDAEKSVDPLLIDTAVDFIRVYADRTHHGKEEDILFAKLGERSLSEDDRRLMEELIDEHVYGRKVTQALVAANERYRHGDASALFEISENLRTLVDFYPRHIAKEDKTFFPAAMSCFSEEEDQSLLAAYHDFDRTMIHEKYESVVKDLEGEGG